MAKRNKSKHQPQRKKVENGDANRALRENQEDSSSTESLSMRRGIIVKDLLGNFSEQTGALFE